MTFSSIPLAKKWDTRSGGIRLADRVERLFASQAAGGGLHHLERPLHAALDRGHEKLLLRAEEPEDVGLRDPGRAGDRLRRAAFEAAGRELGQGGLEDLLPPLLGASPG
jgi:hypothetical protein